MEFRCSFLRRHFTGKLVVASQNVGCFVRLNHWKSLCYWLFHTLKKSVFIRDGPLENLWGKNYSCYGLKKIHTRNLITQKNSCCSKIPLRTPHNFSNGPSVMLAEHFGGNCHISTPQTIIRLWIPPTTFNLLYKKCTLSVLLLIVFLFCFLLDNSTKTVVVYTIYSKVSELFPVNDRLVFASSALS